MSDAIKFVESNIAGGDGGGNSFESKLADELFPFKSNEKILIKKRIT